ncbi:MAG: flagellar protein FlaG [Idiomarinaceae bacterium HL-53]|nr:MAG: flagellar protein FlaG [Idiomarinaceae bacterium HL-53]CUS47196.1 flagellar protein FlaG [Idiomarinaceae bacterium HL-53]
MSIEITAKVNSQNPLREALKEQTEQARGTEVLAESLQGSGRQKEADQAQKTEQELPLEAKEIGEVVEKLNEVLEVGNRQLQFRVDNDANRTVISVLDQESGEKIRQIPSEDVLRLVSRMQEMGDGVEKAVGVLIDSKI